MNDKTHEIKTITADPSALGLFGLAMVTLVASSQKLGWTEGLSMLIPWALFLGAFAQLFACIGDAKRNNVFGTTAFGGYAFFWFAVAFSWLVKLGFFGEKLMLDADTKQLGVAFVGYLIFTLFMTVLATETNKVLFIIFLLINFLFIGLSLSTFGIAPEFTSGLAAWSELLIAIFSFYGSAASVFNNHLGKEVIAVGKPFGILKK